MLMPASIGALLAATLLPLACKSNGGANRGDVAQHAPALPPGEAPPGMVWVPGGEFRMGGDDKYAVADERPVHSVSVDGFFMDARVVTNAEFQAFVRATGYVTIAERNTDVAELMRQLPPGTPPPGQKLLVPGSLVFAPTKRPVDLHDWSQWWTWTPGTDWRHPDGPQSSIKGNENHPVVQVAWDDAVAYVRWAGCRLPTEAEWGRSRRRRSASMIWRAMCGSGRSTGIARIPTRRMPRAAARSSPTTHIAEGIG